MKIKILELNPNPFKKKINGGKLNKEQVNRIKANIKELGLMGSLPVFKKDDKYYLINGHHRLQALKEVYGKDFEVEVTIHNYLEENILRGMVVENLTQRKGDFIEELENLRVIREWLQNNKCSTVEHLLTGKVGHPPIQDAGSVRDIYSWLCKNGEVMSIGTISQVLKVGDQLDKNLIEKVDKSKSGAKIKDDDAITFSQAVMLSSFENKEEQKDLAEALKNSEVQGRDKQKKLIEEYKKAEEKIKKEVRKGEKDIAEIPIENLKENIKKKIEEDKEKNKGKISVIHYKQFQREAGNKIGKTNDEIIKTCAFLNGLNNSGVLYDLDWKTMLKIIESGTKSGKGYVKFMERILEEIQ